MIRRLALLLCAILTAVISAAAQRGPVETGEISGIVIRTGDSPILLARVLVTISGDALKPSRTVITDDAGRFAFKDLPAGRFTLVAMRPPYIRTTFGARRPGRPGTPINLAAGERVAGVTIPMARGAAITGIVRNPGAEPAPGIEVVATPLDVAGDPSGMPFLSDDRGVYRLFGLSPGNYIVKASIAGGRTAGFSQVSDAEMDQILGNLQRRTRTGATSGASTPGTRPATTTPRDAGARSTYAYAPIYYPGTSDPEQAQVLTLAEGDERAGVDFDLQPVRTSTVEGRVSIAGGALPSGIQVTLTRSSTRARLSDPFTTVPARPDPSGGFRFANVLPGTYRVLARATSMTPAPSQPGAALLTGVFWALADITVAGADVTGMAMTLQPGLKLTGRFAFDARTLTPPETVQLRIAETSGASALARTGGGRANGSFEVIGLLPGTYTVTSPLTDAGWWLRSVVIDGRDVLDFPLELGAEGDVGGAVATFTDQRTELSGTLQSAAHIPAPDYFVVVFSADRTFWRSGSRRVQFTRPSTDGRFIVRDLPSGDYLIAAVADLVPADLADTSFLERLIPTALKIHLDDGEKKTQDLRLVR